MNRGPWWFVLAADDPLPRFPGTRVDLDGAAMRDEAGAFAEFARALAFPEWFGHNWNALDDCLADLGWLADDGWLLVVADAGQLLADEPPERTGLLLDVLARAGEAWSDAVELGQWWDRPARPFHVVLRCRDAASARRFSDRARLGGADLARGRPHPSS